MIDPAPQPSPDQPRLPALCPYCGHGHTLSPDKPRPLQCGACNGRFEPLSRQATQNAMGPWQIRDPEHPFRPPCSTETIIRLAQRGSITPTTIVRGPTTRQFWTYARDTPGLAAVLGQCHACHTRVSPDDQTCPSCEADLYPPTDRQQLGLSPKAILPGEAPPEQIASLIRPRTPAPMPSGAAEPEAQPIAVTPDTVSDAVRTEAPEPEAPRPRLWPRILVGAQTIIILTLAILLLARMQDPDESPRVHPSTESLAQTPPRSPSPPQPVPPPTGATPTHEPAAVETPAPSELQTLMDEAMRPYEHRYWLIIEGIRSEETSTLASAIAQLRGLRGEAVAANPGAAMLLTDDVIEQAEKQLARLRLLKEFSARH